VQEKLENIFFSDFRFRRGILVPIRDAGTDFLKGSPVVKKIPYLKKFDVKDRSQITLAHWVS
jgi:hypothetical protein